MSEDSNCSLFAGDVGKPSDDISLTLVESCSHDHGKHTHINKKLFNLSGFGRSGPFLMFHFFVSI